MLRKDLKRKIQQRNARQRRNTAIQISRSKQAVRPGGFVPMYGMRGEKKVFDIDNTTYQVNTTGTLIPICIPQTGSDFTNRIGRKIRIRSVFIRGYVSKESGAGTAASGPQLLRMILLVDKQPNGVAATTTEVLKQATSVSQLNLNNRERFQVIKDKTFILDPFDLSTLTFNRLISPVKVYKKLNIPVIFNASSTGNISDINTNALYMMWIGNVAAGSGSDGNAIVTTRVRFEDM